MFSIGNVLPPSGRPKPKHAINWLPRSGKSYFLDGYYGIDGDRTGNAT